MTHVMACIDGSASSAAVCDYACWASQRLAAPLTFLHVLDHRQYPAPGDLSGTIGLGSREHLLDELAALDEKRARLALEQGRSMLDAARDRAAAAGITAPHMRQRHGHLVETLHELEPDTRLLVMGRQGHDSPAGHLGSHLENVIRAVQRPILVTPPRFETPRGLLLAFDGSPTMRKGVETIAASPLLAGLPIHAVTVGADTADSRAQLDWAQKTLAQAGYRVTTDIRAGDVEPTLHAYQREHDLDLLAMGAYGHSRIRQFLVGSTTTSMIRTSTTPLLLLR
ncbi:universal stress protein [Stutzerimonas urumqiensis]|uniref:universal stress protein n=1 Tax=Stutzerimonas urumqiensis TaxID=638269 RepID=UPI003DA67432